MRTVHEINLQRHFGGGEVYTRFLSNALVEAGWPVELYVHNEATFWDRLDMPGVRIVPHAVFPVTVKSDWWRWPGTARLIAREYTKFVVAWARQNLGIAARARDIPV